MEELTQKQATDRQELEDKQRTELAEFTEKLAARSVVVPGRALLAASAVATSIKDVTVGPASAASRNAMTCDSGWTYFGDHCYKRISTRVYYDAAQSVCKGYSGIIAVPNTEAENTFLSSTMNPSRVAYTWIGFDYTNSEQWEDGSDSSMSSSWRVLYSVDDAAARVNGQPVAFIRPSGAWSFDRKSNRMEYVCEKPCALCVCTPAHCNTPGCL